MVFSYDSNTYTAGLWLNQQPLHPPSVPVNPPLVYDSKPKLEVGHATCLIANFRCYKAGGALSPDDLLYLMADAEPYPALLADLPPALAQKIRSVKAGPPYPLDFALLNEHGEPVVYLPDGPQALDLNVSNASTREIDITPQTGPASNTNYHFALTFRPGVLEPGATVKTGAVDWNAAQETETIYLLYTGADALKLTPSNGSMTLPLEGFAADATRGTRGTRVQLCCRNLAYPGPLPPVSRTKYLYLLNETRAHAAAGIAGGGAPLPLQAQLVGRDVLLSDGHSTDDLKIRLFNVWDGPITLKKNQTQFSVLLDPLVNKTGIVWEPAGKWKHHGNEVTYDDANDGTLERWQAHHPATPGTNCINLTLQGLMTTEAGQGVSFVQIHYKNLYQNDGTTPFDDGFLLVPFRREPAVFKYDSDKAVLDSGNSPLKITTGQTLDVEAKGAITLKSNGHLGLSIDTSGNVGIGPTAPDHILHIKGNAAKANPVLFLQPFKWKKPEDYGELRFGDSNHYIKAEFGIGMTIHDMNSIALTGSNVGIGTESPKSTLCVSGGVAVGSGYAEKKAGDKNLIVEGKVGIGTTDLKEKLNVNGAISGFGVVPIGTIVAWHKSFSGTPALPDGWVECNGQTLDDSASVYNGEIIPNLNGKARFLRGGKPSGKMQNDAFQGHWHEAPIQSGSKGGPYHVPQLGINPQ